MNFIEINTMGKILRYSDAPVRPKDTRESVWAEISDKAAFYLMENRIEFLYETEAISYCPPGILRHKSEMRDVKGYVAPDSIFDFRIELFSQNWEKLKSLVKPNGKNLLQLSESIASLSNSSDAALNDAVVMSWMLQNEPCWRVTSLSSDVAALVFNSKIETEEVSMEFPILCLRASDGYLFSNVKEILAFKDGDDIIIAISYSIAKGLNVYQHASLAGILKGRNSDKNLVDAVSFIEKFLAVKECDKSPIEIFDRESEKLAKKGIKKVSGIFRYQVSLSKRYEAIKRERHEALDKDGKVLTTVKVSGFVRNQAYGEGRALRKRIWVDGFTRGQWVNAGVTYVTLGK